MLAIDNFNGIIYLSKGQTYFEFDVISKNKNGSSKLWGVELVTSEFITVKPFGVSSLSIDIDASRIDRKAYIYLHNSIDDWYCIQIYPTSYELPKTCKFYKYQQYVSHDSGVTWQATSEYERGELYETNSVDCGYVPSSLKYSAAYSTEQTNSKNCDNSTTLTNDELGRDENNVRVYAPFSMITVEIGNCVTNLDEDVFFTCTSLTSVTIPNSVTSIGDKAFWKCSDLPSIDIPDSVTSIGGKAFADCSGLTSVDLPSGITEIKSFSFENCVSLPSIDIPDSVTSIGDKAFSGCTNLSSIDIPDSVTSIGGSAFHSCTSLTSCTIGNGVESISGSVFQGCSNLISVTITAVVPPTLGDSYVFWDTNSCPIYVPCPSVSAYKSDSTWSRYASRIRGIAPCDDTLKFRATYSNGTIYSAECDSNSTLTTGNTHPNGYTYTAMTSAVIGECVTSIGTSAFTNCTNLSAITIPNTVTIIGERSFYGCSGLTNVTIPSSVTEISPAAFARCSDLTSINIPNSVQTIGYSVYTNCSSLTNVTIGTGVTSLGNYVFDVCTALTSITINATTPPTIGANTFRDTNNCPIYVPSESVNAYKAATNWSTYASRIQAIP